MKRRTSVANVSYKTYKNKLTSILKSCEKKYYSKLLEEKHSNAKETWNILNSVIKRTILASKDLLPDQFVSDDNKIIDNRKDISNGFNQFFVNAGPKLANKIVKSKDDPSVNNFIKSWNNNSMF